MIYFITMKPLIPHHTSPIFYHPVIVLWLSKSYQENVLNVYMPWARPFHPVLLHIIQKPSGRNIKLSAVWDDHVLSFTISQYKSSSPIKTTLTHPVFVQFIRTGAWSLASEKQRWQLKPRTVPKASSWDQCRPLLLLSSRSVLPQCNLDPWVGNCRMVAREKSSHYPSLSATHKPD